MKRLCILLIGLALQYACTAQLSTGSAGWYIASGTPFAFDSLMLIPAQDLLLTGNTLSKSYAPQPAGTTGNQGIARVYAFSTPISWRGIAAISYDNTELNGNTAGLLELVYHDGVTGYTGNGMTSAAGSNNVSATTSGGPVNVQRFTAVSNANPLPAGQLTFTAVKEGTAARLEWTVAGTRKVQQLRLTRSADAQTFTDLYSQADNGTSDTRYDRRPLKGWNYYRLQVIYEDGTQTYSRIAPLFFDDVVAGPENVFTVYPVPTDRYVYVRLSAQQELDLPLQLSDVSGKTLWQSVVHLTSGIHTIPIDLQAFATGTLLLQAGTYPPVRLIRQ